MKNRNAVYLGDAWGWEAWGFERSSTIHASLNIAFDSEHSTSISVGLPSWKRVFRSSPPFLNLIGTNLVRLTIMPSSVKIRIVTKSFRIVVWILFSARNLTMTSSYARKKSCRADLVHPWYRQSELCMITSQYSYCLSGKTPRIP